MGHLHRYAIAVFLLVFCCSSSAQESINFNSLVAIGTDQQNTFKTEFNRNHDSNYTLLQFWASWCHSCAGFMYDLDKITADTQSPYFAINIDDKIQKAESYLATHPLFKRKASRYWFDANSKLKSYYDIDAVPAIVVIDSQGKSIWRATGHLNSEDLLKLRQLLLTNQISTTKKEV